MYADYSFYVSEYGGKLDELDFTINANKASYYIDGFTMDRAHSYYKRYSGCCDNRMLKKLEMACCAVADAIASFELSKESSSEMSGVYQSETVGAHSVSYRTGSEMDKTLRDQISGILGVYLAGTGLLYRGIPVCIPHML